MPMVPPNWTGPVPRRPLRPSSRAERWSNATVPAMFSSACGRLKWRMRPSRMVIVPLTAGSRIGPVKRAASTAPPLLRMFGSNAWRMPRLALPAAVISTRSSARVTLPETSSSVSCPTSRISAMRKALRSNATLIGSALLMA